VLVRTKGVRVYTWKVRADWLPLHKRAARTRCARAELSWRLDMSRFSAGHQARSETNHFRERLGVLPRAVPSKEGLALARRLPTVHGIAAWTEGRDSVFRDTKPQRHPFRVRFWFSFPELGACPRTAP
jgi:hypothetical protein